jgi:hypothetical protein
VLAKEAANNNAINASVAEVIPAPKTAHEDIPATAEHIFNKRMRRCMLQMRRPLWPEVHLGHLPPPYDEKNPPSGIPAPQLPLDKIGVTRWQYDLWYQIIVAALEGHSDQVRLDYHPALDQPAASRYAATTPQLLGWFKPYNQNRLYRDQVRPFGFLLAFQAVPPALAQAEIFDLGGQQGKKVRRNTATPLRPVAPHNCDIGHAAKNCLDGETGKPVDPSLLKSYRMALAQYHVSPEPKFLNGEPYDRGPTRRRHVEAIAINCIGKEANRWEEQYYLGLNIDAQTDYGMLPEGSGQLQAAVKSVARLLSQRELAKSAGICRTTLSKLMQGKPVGHAEQIIGRVLTVIRKAEHQNGKRSDRSPVRPKERLLDRIGGLGANETPEQLRDRIKEIDRLEPLFRSGTLHLDKLESVQRRLCYLKGIYFGLPGRICGWPGSADVDDVASGMR